MKERHGVPDAVRISASSKEKQYVEVTDGDGMVLLSLGSGSYPAGLTVEQALFIADQLRKSAKRVSEEAHG